MQPSNLWHKLSDKISNKLSSKISNKLSNKHKLTAAAIAASLLLFAGTGAILADSTVYSLSIRGQSVGYLDNQEELTQAVTELTADQQKESKDLTIRFLEEEVELLAVTDVPKGAEMLSDKELKQLLSSHQLLVAEAWSIRINGKDVVYAATEAEANSILDGVKREYQTTGSKVISATFKESVELINAPAPLDSILEQEEAVYLITLGNKEPKVYTVQGGDTVWDIAIENKMTTDQLIAANPGFDPEKLTIGQQLNLFEIKPYVTVRITEELTATEKIPFETIYENNSALYKGEVKVEKPGVAGSKEVLSRQVLENGVLVSSEEVSSKVVSEPQAQVSSKGTKSLATFVGTGSFVRPVSGSISSGFGSRGGSRHTGIDIPRPKGTPIAVADDGVVTFAGSYYAYGNLIKISHGNGVETWYGHCDSISVSVGEIVKKGETIGTVGNTGRSTGSHLHFEVRKNGSPQNPANYL